MAGPPFLRDQASNEYATATAAPDTQDLATIERQTIERMLQQTDWNKSKTARRLGLTRTQLYVRLRRYGIESAED